MNADWIVVLVTVPTPALARDIASTVVKERLAACANALAAVQSIFQWQGQIECEEEQLLILKTRKSRFEQLRRRVVELHEYDVPEVIALGVVAGHEPYLRWIDAETEA